MANVVEDSLTQSSSSFPLSLVPLRLSSSLSLPLQSSTHGLFVFKYSKNCLLEIQIFNHHMKKQTLKKCRNIYVFASSNSSGISAVCKFIFPPSVVIFITPMSICRKWLLLILIFSMNKINIMKHTTLILYYTILMVTSLFITANNIMSAECVMRSLRINV